MAVGALNDHVVDFYLTDHRLVRRVSAFLAASLRDGEAAVVVATPEHRSSIESALAGRGIDLAAARLAGQWVALDASEILGRIRGPQGLDRRRFSRSIGEVLSSVTGGGKHVRVYGEMVQLLWERGDVNGAIALESLWNELSGQFDFALYCAYRALDGEDAGEAIEAICRLHSEVVYRHGVVPARSASAGFEPLPPAAAAARRFLRSVLEGWGLETIVDVAEVVLTELATNAVLHARSPFQVVLSEGPTSLRVSVHDHNRDLPRRYDADLRAFSGRGLYLVEGLSAEWGCSVRPDGKEVWAELEV